MGKVQTYLATFIFIDLLFIITGQICSTDGCSLSSIIFGAILDLNNINTSTWFSNLIGEVFNLLNSGVGLAALLATSGVLIGAFFATREIKILFIPMAVTLSLVAGDLVFIYNKLFGLNAVLATLFMAPMILIYLFNVVDWLRGKD